MLISTYNRFLISLAYVKEATGDFRLNSDNTEGRAHFASLVSGYSVAMRITVYAIEFGVLCWFGRFIDVTFDFSPWGLICGGGIALATFLVGVVSIVKGVEEKERLVDQNAKKREDDGEQ